MANRAEDKFTIYYEARQDHAWRLRAAGLTYRQIGERIGLSVERTRQIIVHHGRWLRPRQLMAYPYYGWEGTN